MTIQTDKSIKEKIVLALDVDTIDEAKKLINELKDYVGVFKVGLQLYTKCGNEIIKFMNDENIKCYVKNEKKVIYQDEEYSLSSLAKQLLGANYNVAGTHYFTYKGEKLCDLRERLSLMKV